MGSNSRDIGLVVQVFIGVFLLSSRASYGTDTDIYCLQTLKASLQDPLGYLNSTWIFKNQTEGFICKFIGIECWHVDESKVLAIMLSSLGLKGRFPRGLENCTSLTGLDLSDNSFSGAIPSDINVRIPFVTNLDLSSNLFSGQIPVNLSAVVYLNVLKLDSNRFSGSIPLELGNLNRIKTFNISNNNRLSGQVPNFPNADISAESYANDPGLCGGPLKRCKKKIGTQI